MKILLIGASGTIGSKVSVELEKRHEVVKAGRNSGDINIDISDISTIKKAFGELKDLDACICCAGDVAWAELSELSEEDFYVGIKSKLMGQINLVRIGQKFLKDNGSFTLTTGILAEDPVKTSAVASMVNGGIHSFVLAAAQELQRGLRINAVSAGVVEDAYEKYASFFPGHTPVSMSKVGSAYCKSVEGIINGQIIRVY